MKRLTVLILLAAVASFAVVACGRASANNVEPTPVALGLSPPPPPPAPTQIGGPPVVIACAPHEPDGEELSVSFRDLAGTGQYAFDPAELAFNVGDTVNFTLTSEAEGHTFTLDDLGFDVSVGAGETLRCSFTFDKPGTFPLICIPHELQGMVGTITVNS